jgi:hypothetical protein
LTLKERVKILWSIFLLLKNKNTDIDVKSDWFQELWYPLSKKRGILGSTPLIVVRTLLLEWLGYVFATKNEFFQIKHETNKDGY